MSESTLSNGISLEVQVLGYLLNFKFYDERVKNIITRDMFEGETSCIRRYQVRASELQDRLASS